MEIGPNDQEPLRRGPHRGDKIEASEPSLPSIEGDSVESETLLHCVQGLSHNAQYALSTILAETQITRREDFSEIIACIGAIDELSLSIETPVKYEDTSEDGIISVEQPSDPILRRAWDSLIHLVTAPDSDDPAVIINTLEELEPAFPMMSLAAHLEIGHNMTSLLLGTALYSDGNLYESSLFLEALSDPTLPLRDQDRQNLAFRAAERMLDDRHTGPLLTPVDLLELLLEDIDFQRSKHQRELTYYAERELCDESLLSIADGKASFSLSTTDLHAIANITQTIRNKEQLQTPEILRALLPHINKPGALRTKHLEAISAIVPHYAISEWDPSLALQSLSYRGLTESACELQSKFISKSVEEGARCDLLFGPGLNEVLNQNDIAKISAVYQASFSTRNAKFYNVLDRKDLENLQKRISYLIENRLIIDSDPIQAGNFASDYLAIFEHFVTNLKADPKHNKQLKQVYRDARSHNMVWSKSHALSQIVLYLKNEESVDETTLTGLVRDSLCQAAYFSYARDVPEHVEEAASRVLLKYYQHDGPPYATGVDWSTLGQHIEPDPRAQVSQNRSLQIARIKQELHENFDAYTFPSRRAPEEKHCALVQFGIDTAEETFYLNSSTFQKFPGNGFGFYGIRPERFMVADNSKPKDPYKTYRDAWEFYPEVFDDLQKSEILFLRGLYIVIPPVDTGRFELHDRSQALIVYNEHFYNHRNSVAALVDRELISEIVRPMKLALELGPQFDPLTEDIVGAPLGLASLNWKSKNRGLQLYNLAWPSNMGGMCNAYRACSEPLHRHDRQSRGDLTRDRAGHVHKYFALDTEQATDLSELGRQQIRAFQEADDNVASLAFRTSDLFDAFRLAHSTYNLGDTVTAADIEDYESEEDSKAPWTVEYEWEKEKDAAKLATEGSFLSPEDLREEIQLGPHSTRGLQAIYRWHQLAKQGRPVQQCPEFAVLPARNFWETQSPVIIDPYSLMVHLSFGNQKEAIQLPTSSDGTGYEEVEIWREYVMRYFVPGMDFRPMERGKIELSG